MKIKKVLFNSAGVILIILSLMVGSCQKDNVDLSPSELSQFSLKSAKSLKCGNADKHDLKILFVSKRDGNDEIYSMNVDGSNVLRLTNNVVPDGRATWSANGQHVAFASGVVGSRDIFIMNAKGQGLRNLTNTAADEDWPEWSPEGNCIIFSSNRDGNHEIYKMDQEGHHIRRLTNSPQDDKWPSYSPNGNKIGKGKRFSKSDYPNLS